MDGKAINRRVDELLELFSIKDSADQLVSTYSGGMRRKLDIATALIHNPQLIFLDEPTLGLDPHSRSQLWNYIRMLNRDLKVTIFLTTHYLDEADKLSNRIGILHKGSIKIIDTPDKLKDSIRGDSVNLELKGSAKDKAISILKGDSKVKEILLENDHVRVYVNNGSEAIQWLMKLLNQNGIDVSSLSISRPSLDDVYLKYSGASFKEGDSSEGGEPWWAKWQKGGWGKNWKGGEDSSQDSQEGGQQEWGKEWGNGDKQLEGSEDKGDKEQESGDKGWGNWSPEEMKAWWSQSKNKENETTVDPGHTTEDKNEAVGWAPPTDKDWTKGEWEMEQDDKQEVTADKDKEDIKDKENKEEENIEEPWKKWQGTPEAAEWWSKQGKKEG